MSAQTVNKQFSDDKRTNTEYHPKKADKTVIIIIILLSQFSYLVILDPSKTKLCKGHC